MQEKILDIEPRHYIVWTLSNDVLTSKYSYLFTADSAQTEVLTNHEITGNNAFMKSVLFLSKGYLKNADAEMLARLKKVAEQKQ